MAPSMGFSYCHSPLSLLRPEISEDMSSQRGCTGLGDGGGVAESETAGGEGAPQLWMPMEASAMPRWRGVDWLRFYFYKCALGPGYRD